jgi:hypothetical protein
MDGPRNPRKETHDNPSLRSLPWHKIIDVGNLIATLKPMINNCPKFGNDSRKLSIRMRSELASWTYSSLLYAVISGAGRSCVPALR